jgi:tRNA-intron endonuclease
VQKHAEQMSRFQRYAKKLQDAKADLPLVIHMSDCGHYGIMLRRECGRYMDWLHDTTGCGYYDTSVEDSTDRLIVDRWEIRLLQLELNNVFVIQRPSGQHQPDEHHQTQESERDKKLFRVFYECSMANWVCKLGAKFGCDFLLYRYGPSVDHAPYMLILEDASLPVDATDSWKSLARVTRIAQTVQKQVLLARFAEHDRLVLVRVSPLMMMR